MGESLFSSGRPVIVGANHKSSGLMLRDRLFVEDGAVPEFLGRLRQAGLTQALVLSTCDRVEVQAIDPGADEAPDLIARALADHAEMAPGEIDGQLYTLWDDVAVRHVFTVAASLDSQIVGEPQVLGQVKACHRLARDAGMTGSALEAILQAAYSAAKRVRNETAIGERPVSISAAAVQIAREVHGDLDRCTGLLIGAGDMGEMVARDLISAGLSQLTVTHPTEKRAEGVARALDAHVAAYDTLSVLLAEADIVLAAAGRRRYLLTGDMVTAALGTRRQKPVFIIDAAIPGDVEPAVNRIDGAFLYDLGDLEGVAMGGRADREAEAQAAWRIIDAEVGDFLRGRAERGAVPALNLLRDHFEDSRAEVLASADHDADEATRLLVNRLLHVPSQVLKEQAAGQGRGQEEAEWRAMERMVRRLFRLDGEDTEESK
jgi:glutamyl-tRNA reductase